jgi:thiamine kinase-like enzyme
VKASVETSETLTGLLNEIHKESYADECCWSNWTIVRVKGGRNNLLYKAQQQDQILAIKFCVPDQRDRAGREYQCLDALKNAGSQIVPEPLLLDRYSYKYPVVVQTWLEGEVSSTPPENKQSWLKLVEHFIAIQKALSPTEAMKLPRAVLTMTDAASGIEQIQRKFLLIPESKHSEAVRKLIDKLSSKQFPLWNEPVISLCRSDPSPLNFIRRSGAWCSVDWENGGWGDPAFEIADLMAHPSYSKVESSQWNWLIDIYAKLVNDEQVSQRIYTYYRLMIAWWVVRFSKELAAPAELLMKREPNWQLEAFENLTHYLSLSDAILI